MTRRRFLRLALFLLAALFLLSVISISDRDSRSVTLRVGFWAGSYWGVPTSDSYAVLDAGIAKFQETHPDVQVEYETGILQRDYTESLMADMLIGQAPDVMLLLPEDFESIVSIGGLAEITAAMLPDDSLFYPATLSAGQWDGKQYALPYECVPTLMFVNKTLLEREHISLPDNTWTWDDFYAICQAVTRDTDGDGILDQYGCCNYTWEDALCSSGASLFSEDGKSCNLTSTEMLDSVSFVQKLEALSGEHTVTSEEFEEGQVAFRPMLFSEYRTYQSYPWQIKKYSRFQWDCLKMPAAPSGGNISELTTLLMGISSQSHHQDLAWELLQTLTCDEEVQRRIYADSQGCSPLPSVTAAEETADILQENTLSAGSLNLTTLDETLRTAAAVPRFQDYSETMALVRTRVGEAMQQPDSLRMSLASAQVEINRKLNS